MGPRYLAVLLAGITMTTACGRQCFYWRDTTGKDRDERVQIADSKTCHLDEAYGPEKAGAQDPFARMYDCMTKHGWVMADRNCPPNER